MKTIFLYLILILLIGCHKKSLSSKSIASNNINSNNLNLVLNDTTKKKNNDTSIAFGKIAIYETSQDTLKFLSKYFEKDVCNPGNINHPKYLAFLEKSDELIPEIKVKLKAILTNYENSNKTENCPAIGPFKKKLDIIERLNNCSFYPIPYYYLTYNVAERKSNDLNILKYFNLDTLSIYFKAELFNQVIGIIKYSNKGAIKISCFYPQDSLGLTKIETLKKDAILIKRDLVNQGSSYQNFGFITDNNLFFSNCFFEEIIQRNENTQETKRVYNQGCEFVHAFEFYLKPALNGTELARIIKDGFISKKTMVQ